MLTLLQANPLWWAQPAATIGTGVCAVLGVLWTLKNHEKRLRKEQRERRAKDRERMLQDAYSEFVAAATDLPPLVSLLGHLHRNSSKATAPETLAACNELANTARDKMAVAEASFLSAFCRIRIVDHLSERRDKAASIHRRVSSVQPYSNMETYTSIEAELEEFVNYLRTSLHEEYTRDADLIATSML